MSAPRSTAAWVDLGLLTLCWASGFTFTAIALEGFAPQWVVVFRQLVATLVLIPLAFAFGRIAPIPRRMWLWLIALAIMGDMAPFYVISWGQQEVESGLASILVTTMPLMTLALAHVFVPGERMTPRRLAGFVIGLSGVALIVGPEALLEVGVSDIEILSQLAILLGAVMFAANAIIARNMPQMDVWQRAMMVNGLSCLIAFPLALSLMPVNEAPSLDALPGWWPIFGVVGTGIFASGLATVIYFRLIDEAGPTFMSITNYLVPPVALIAGIVLLDESPSMWAFAGLVLILAGIAVAELRRAPKHAAGPAPQDTDIS